MLGLLSGELVSADPGTSGAGEREINGELAGAGLISQPRPGPDTEVLVNYAGWLNEVTARPVAGASDLLEVRVGIGTTCGYDQTMAIYNRSPVRRLGVVNSSIGRPNEVQVPWWFSPVAVGPKDRDGRRLLAVGGNSGWCTSNTRGGTLRVDEILDTSMRTLLDRDVSYWSGNDAYITAAVLGSTAEFRYGVMLYPDLMARQAIARFSRAGSGLQRGRRLH